MLRKVDERMPALDAGVVDEDVDRPDASRGGGHAFTNGAAIGDVEQRDVRRDAFSGKHGRRARERIGVAAVEDHARAGSRQGRAQWRTPVRDTRR